MSERFGGVATDLHQEHCDWCGEEMGRGYRTVWAPWRDEYLNVHRHCVADVQNRGQKFVAKAIPAQSPSSSGKEG